MSMILEILFSIFACVLALSGTVLAILIACLIIRDIINDLKRWYEGDDWGWIEISKVYGYQHIFG